jgi:hypothetical protein
MCIRAMLSATNSVVSGPQISVKLKSSQSLNALDPLIGHSTLVSRGLSHIIY